MADKAREGPDPPGLARRATLSRAPCCPHRPALGSAVGLSGTKPFELAAGDWAEVVAPVQGRPYCLGRLGLVRLVFWSFNRNRQNPARSSPEPQWMARVEFASQHARSRGPRVTYTLPLTTLGKSSAQTYEAELTAAKRLSQGGQS